MTDADRHGNLPDREGDNGTIYVDNPQHVILIGAPGVGKSTLGDKLARRYGVMHLNPGEWYRTAAKTSEYFIDVIDSKQEVDKHTWHIRTEIFLRACEQRVAEICYRNGIRHFIIERKDADLAVTSMSIGHVAAVFYITASKKARTARCAERKRVTGRSDAKRQKSWGKRVKLLEKRMKKQNKKGLALFEIDSTAFTAQQVANKASDWLDSIGFTANTIRNGMPTIGPDRWVHASTQCEAYAIVEQVLLDMERNDAWPRFG